MNNNFRKKYVAIIVVLICFNIIMTISILFVYKNNIRKNKMNYSKTNAEILDFEVKKVADFNSPYTGSSISINQYLIIQYKVDKKNFVKDIVSNYKIIDRNYNHESYQNTYKIGDKIDVWYNSQNPNDVLLKPSKEQERNLRFYIFLGILIISFSTLVFFIIKFKSIKKEREVVSK